MGEKRLWFRLMVAVMLAGTLALGGCSGDDGDDGVTIEGKSAYEIAKDNGFVGTEAEWLASLQAPANPAVSTVPPVETCYMCHETGKSAAAVDAHAVTGQLSFANTGVVAAGDDLIVTFDLALDGQPTDAYATTPWPDSGGPTRAVVMYYDPIAQVYKRQTFDRTANYDTTVAVAAGSYTLTIARSAAGGVAGVPIPATFAAPGIDARYYFRLGATNLPSASVSFEAADYARDDLALNAACINCHGDILTDGTSDVGTSNFANHHNNPFRVEACITCHAPDNNVGAAAGKLVQLIHGIHNSYDMPAGKYTYGNNYAWKVTYPTYMLNCSVCHDTTAGADAAKDSTVSYNLCMSCHGDWTGYSKADGIFGGVNHNGYTTGGNCGACHDGGIARKFVKDFHNGLTTGRAGVIWDGRDTSVDEGAKIDMQITGVSYPSDTQMAVTWTTTYDADGPGGAAPVAVNPCNTTVAAGAPIFHAGGAADTTTGKVAGNFSILRAYAEGDDWTNNGIGTSPGQPVATNLSTTNTTCAANVATTIITLTAEEQATTATKGIVALQGKAQVVLPGITDYNPSVAGNQTVDQVRSKTPTREFLLGTGAQPAPADRRRSIADTADCLKCHVGSLYQHGGNRVDSVDMCMMCHNEASSEQNVRLLDGVDATEAYDGQAGQTYGFKSLLHAVHSTGTEKNPNKITMVYRTNGVYVWAPKGVTPPNWPGTGPQIVYGSNNVTRTHNLHSPTYPRALNDCSACHAVSFDMVPNQDKSMATTVNAGTVALSSAVPPTAANLVNGNGTDDTLEGTGAAACTSCHQPLKAHAYQNGWAPAVFPNGRQTIINNAP